MDHSDETDELIRAILALTAEYPGMHGRLRTARVVGGYDIGNDERFDRFAVATTWTLSPLVDLIDELIDGGLLAQTAGARPVLVLPRAGFRALAAIEAADTVPLT